MKDVYSSFVRVSFLVTFASIFLIISGWSSIVSIIANFELDRLVPNKTDDVNKTTNDGTLSALSVSSTSQKNFIITQNKYILKFQFNK